MALIRQIVTIYKNYDYKTQVLVASVRHPQHVVEAALVKHPLTDSGLKKFLADWDAMGKK